MISRSSLEIVHLALESREPRVREVERDADDRLAVGASPLVGEVAHRAEVAHALALELAIELMDEALDRRAFEAKTQLADALPEELFHICRVFSKSDTAGDGSGDSELSQAAE